MLQGLLRGVSIAGAGVAGPTITYIGTTEVAGGATTCQFTNAAIGTAAADRLVVVVIAAVRSIAPSRTLSGVTIGGNAATVHNSIVNDSGTTGPNVSISSLVVAAGTTATVIATLSGATSEAVMSVYTITGYVSATPVASNSNAVASGDPSTTANVTGTGAAIGGWVGSSGAQAAATFTGLATKNYDADVSAINNTRFASAQSGGLITETPRTFSATSTMTAETIIVATWN